MAGGVPPDSFYGNSTTVAGDQIQDRRFSGGDTLDEPVTETLMRDVRAVGRRVQQVLRPKPASEVDVEGQVTRDWDLWGPLVFCLFLALALSISAPSHQTSTMFSGVFAFVWIAESFVTLNIKLLGGSISYFHAVCILGYALFPLVPAAVFSLIVHNIFIRLPVDALLIAWSLYAAIRTLKGAGVVQGRVVLALYPVYLFYGWLGWLCVIT
ncbi:Yip1 domain-containing protein [Dipodascopsis tothii]|uniref:Yip1 domain-containing protein n=1 Tax=Dipodascopsis tothii TaxID=44089 RepID=UPI0034CD6015